MRRMVELLGGELFLNFLLSIFFIIFYFFGVGGNSPSVVSNVSRAGTTLNFGTLHRLVRPWSVDHGSPWLGM